MKRKSVCATLLSLAVVAILLIAPVPAGAITNGTADGSAHPSVGMAVMEIGELDIWVTGTLIAPTVFLTCGHAEPYLAAAGTWRVWVTFDSQFDAEVGHFIGGTYQPNPAYSRCQSDPNDVAVVILDHAPVGVTPAHLPTAGQLDTLAVQNRLRGARFTAVGYGFQEAVHTPGGGKPAFTGGGVRMQTMSTFLALTDAWLVLSQNPAHGDGGGCYCDSGGPYFLEGTDVVVAVVSTGDTAARAMGKNYRLDTPAARAYLGQYVSLP